MPDNQPSLSLYRIADIRNFEQHAIASSISAAKLMQCAGVAAFQHLQICWPQAKQIGIFAGKGNNGGDGYVLATAAKAAGLEVWVQYIGDLDILPSPALEAMQTCKAAGVRIEPYSSSSVYQAEVLVDALLGIGLRGEVSGEYQKAIQAINTSGLPVLAMDIPSGLNADTGYVSNAAVQANQTLTFIAYKQGLFAGSARSHCGVINCDTLGIPFDVLRSISPSAQTLFFPQNIFPPRNRVAHKGAFGHVLLIGGNNGMGGAVRLAAEAALRVGAGLVSVATRALHIPAILAARPEIMCHAIEQASDLDSLLAGATVIVVGPGLGQDEWSKSLYQRVVNIPLPKVVDADALNLLSQNPVCQNQWILTPHPGEAARLLNTTIASVEANRYAAADALQKRYGGTVVLKGAGSIIRGSADISHVCLEGNPGMATGGMGDVLSGVIAGLLAQGLNYETAACRGVQIHAKAADEAAKEGERGLLASDLMPFLRKLVN